MSRVTQAATFDRTWENPPGLARLSIVAHKPVGLRFIVTALAFFGAGGILALLIRLQLARPEGGFLSPQAYNEVFTMHGSTMMFLFAVPFMEALAGYLLPMQLGCRDLPFPRLNAFNYWLYLFGGLTFYSSFLFGAAPDGGWFAYPPLTGIEHSPGPNIDFWTIGLALLEIAGIGAAIELIAVTLKMRAPGMTLNRIPVFVWSVFVVAVMILIAFTALLLATVLLEVDRKFGTHFFNAGAGGSPLLWQHLFWIFGHPEVYIMFLPATGIVSMIVPVYARARLVGYPLVVTAIAVTGLLSFGLWVHHMFAVGEPVLTKSFFGATSFVIAIASGVQVFAWIATIARGRRRVAKTPMLYVLGFLVIFVIGGVTGVMIASVPFDWQVHDSFFIVAHFHYVLVGGVVFPAVAGLYYWLPKVTGRLPSERLGVASFWLSFVGFNVTFFPMHLLGFFGMPRRVYTYLPGLGWDGLNLISTIGAFLLAAGFMLTLVNIVRTARRKAPAGDDPWLADSLEWSITSPPPMHNFDAPPVVSSRHPLWDPAVDDVMRTPEREASEALRRKPERWRASLGTSVLDARPEQVIPHPNNTYAPLIAAVGTLLVFLAPLTEIWWLAGVGLVITGAGLIGWIRASDRDFDAMVGEPVEVPHVATRPRDIPWWGAFLTVVSLFALLAHAAFSYFYLRSVNEQWPRAGLDGPDMLWSTLAVLAVVVAAFAGGGARALASRHGPRAAVPLQLLAVTTGALAFALRLLSIDGAGLRHDHHAYDAAVLIFIGIELTALAIATLAGAFVAARSIRRAVPDRAYSQHRVAALLWAGAAVALASGYLVVDISARLL